MRGSACKRIQPEGAALESRGLKLAFHAHTAEYVDVGGGKIGMNIFISETDRSMFSFQMDLGWARFASQDPVAWVKKYPDRFHMWHVKDIEDLKIAQERETETFRALAAVTPRPPVAPAHVAPARAGGRAAGTPPAPQPGRPAPVGNGDVNFKPIMAAWKEWGMQYFFVEQDGAAVWPGGSLASCATSYQNLKKSLSS